MDLEFLSDYYEKEKEQWTTFIRSYKKRGMTFQNYPSLTRFSKYQRPFAFSMSRRPPWVQIPLYGTTIIPLVPVFSEEEFFFSHQFSIDNINRMIEYSKETGKIQFVLGGNPTYYKDMDYIEPILKELNPPQLGVLSTADLIGKDEAQKRYDEFHKNARDKLIPFLINQMFIEFQKIDQKHVDAVDSYLYGMFEEIEFLKYSGNEEITEDIEGLLHTDPENAQIKLAMLNRLYVGPKRSLFEATPCESFEQIQSLETAQYSNLKSKKIEFPYEIGWFLNKELNLISPQNVDGSIEVSEVYSQYDLNKLMHTLTNSINEKNSEKIIETEEEIFKTLDNCWKESDKFSNNIIVNKIASLSVSLIGDRITGYMGNGLLEKIGFELKEDVIKQIVVDKGQEIINYLKSDTIMHVYKFKKKYKI